MSTPSAPAALDDIPGWFPWADQELFTWFLEQQAGSPRGDLLELGAYLGKSAVLIGRHQRDGETFTVCDLFDSPAPDEANEAEMRRTYAATLTRTGFETNYLAFHDALPAIVQAPTSAIAEHVKPGSCRLVHVDASHLYRHVQGDVAAARAALRPDGVAIFDDYRAEHTPGVALAVWEAVVRDGLRPICVTSQKMYATWADPEPLQDELLDRLRERSDLWHEIQEVGGRRLIRVKPQAKAPGDSLQLAKKALAERDAEVARLTGALSREQAALERRTRQLEAVRASLSFRTGRLVTAPARALRDATRTGAGDQ